MPIGFILRSLSCQLLLVACALAESTVVLDNDQVHVIVAKEEPLIRTPLHEHKFNRALIYLQAGSQEILDSKSVPHTINFTAGQTGFARGGSRHMSRIVSMSPVNIVEIEIKKAGDQEIPASPLDPVKVDPKHYVVEFENPQVRLLRVKIGPHESTPLHKHSVNRVVTYLTDQDFKVTSEDGKVERVKHKAGDVAFSGPATHKEENMSGSPFEVVVTELKN